MYSGFLGFLNFWNSLVAGPSWAVIASRFASCVTTASALLALGFSFREELKDMSILTKTDENLALIMKDGKIYTNTLK